MEMAGEGGKREEGRKGERGRRKEGEKRTMLELWRLRK